MPNGATRILLVDDEPGIRLTLSAILSMKGYEVETAVDGVDALEHLSRKKPDVVISDLRMPRMDGFELLSTIRRKHKEVALIAITGEFADVPAGLTADAFFLKGNYRPDDLVAEIRRLQAARAAGANSVA
jgi:two-component system, OmpR family, response regulator MprA